MPGKWFVVSEWWLRELLGRTERGEVTADEAYALLMEESESVEEPSAS